MTTELKEKPRILIIGLGLIGASLAAALKQDGFAGKIDGVVRQAASLDPALASGWLDRVTAQVELFVADADIIVLATPLSNFEKLLLQIKPSLQPHTIVTDVGSVKACVREIFIKVFGTMPPNVVLGHPIAGSERSGFNSADPNLFQRQTVILTPTAETSLVALEAVEKIWLRTGASVNQLEIDAHDQILASTSHLPHLLAFSLVDTLAGDGLSDNIFKYAAGGFRDFTRIAASDPLVWCDIFRANRVAIQSVAKRFRDDLDQLLASLDSTNHLDLLTQSDHVMQINNSAQNDPLLQTLTRAKRARDVFSQVLHTRQAKTN